MSLSSTSNLRDEINSQKTQSQWRAKVDPEWSKGFCSVLVAGWSDGLREAVLCRLSHLTWLFATLWTVAHQAPLSTEILQTRILEWINMPSSRGSSQPRDRTQVSRRRILYNLSYQGSHNTGVGTLSLLRGDLPDPGIKPGSPSLQADYLPAELAG